MILRTFSQFRLCAFNFLFAAIRSLQPIRKMVAESRLGTLHSALWKCNSLTRMEAICSAVRHAERRGADGGCGKMGVIIPSAVDEGTASSTALLEMNHNKC